MWRVCNWTWSNEAEKSIYNGGIKDYISRLRSNTTTEKELRASKSDRLIPLLTVLFELEHNPLHTHTHKRTHREKISRTEKSEQKKTLRWANILFCLVWRPACPPTFRPNSPGMGEKQPFHDFFLNLTHFQVVGHVFALLQFYAFMVIFE